MTTKTRIVSTIALVLALALAGCADPQNDDEAAPDQGAMGGSTADTDDAPTRYRVTIDNLADGQVLSPGVIVAHTSEATVWREGQAPSEGVVAIAEDGNPAPAIENLENTSGVATVVNTEKPINRNGGPEGLPGERSYNVTAESATHLSVVVMTICTNDGFVGVDALELPDSGQTATHRGGVWDAGSEENTEAFPDIVDPCQKAGPVKGEPDGNNDDLPADGNTIRTHPGVQGDADLTVADHGWNETVVEITVTALN